MEEKILTAIQHIRPKSKQRVTLQRIFRFINKGALSTERELLQDCINKLVIGGRIYKKRVKIYHFLINPIAPDSNKNAGPDNVQRVDKSPESPKTIEKLESFVDHDLGNKHSKRSTKYASDKYISLSSKR